MVCGVNENHYKGVRTDGCLLYGNEVFTVGLWDLLSSLRVVRLPFTRKRLPNETENRCMCRQDFLYSTVVRKG